MNPFSTLPLFMGADAQDGRKEPQADSVGCVPLRLCLLMAFLFLGTAIIDFFGISVPGIRIAGGLIISVIGFRMLFPDGTPIAGLQPGPGS
jgi:multiple antibiotic resistance protein